MNRKTHTPESAVNLLMETLGKAVAAESEVEVSAARLLHRLEAEYRQTATTRRLPFREAQTQQRWRRPAVAAAAVVLFLAGGIQILQLIPGSLSARMEFGSLAVLAEGVSRTLNVGDGIETGDLLVAGVEGAVFSLADGSKVEISPLTRLSLARLSDGIELQLASGRILVTAVEQRGGNLYVTTHDCIVSVKGTIFVVYVEEAGSRVSVLEGQVTVQQEENTTTVSQGEQVVTNPAVPSAPIRDEVVWSSRESATPRSMADQRSGDYGHVVQGDPGRIEGTVQNAATGEPLADAVVYLQAGRVQLEATSGTDGRFSIDGLAPGAYYLVASRSGFLGDSVVGTVKVAPGEITRNVYVRMMPASSISGRVFDDTGQPARAVSLSLLRLTFGQDGRMALYADSIGAVATVTDEQGTFQLRDVLPGEYYILAHTDRSPGTPYFYPQVSDSEPAVPITVHPGDVLTNLNFSLPITKLYSVRFKLPPGSPGEPPAISLRPNGRFIYDQNFAASPNIRSISAGEYVILRVPAGRYSLRAQWATLPALGADGRMISSRTAVTAAINVNDKDLDVGSLIASPRVAIPVRVVYADGKFVPVRLFAFPLSEGAALAQIATDASNTAIMRAIPGARYGLDFSLPQDRYVSLAQYGGRDVLHEGMDVDSIDRGALEIVVDGPAGIVEGLVKNARDEPMANTQVALIPPAYRRGNPYAFRTAQTDYSGRFIFNSVSPGEYSIYAWEYLPGAAFKNEDWFREHETRGVAVNVRKGLTSTVNVRIIPRPR